VKSVYTLGTGLGFVPGGNAALTNASLVELGKQLLSAAREGDKVIWVVLVFYNHFFGKTVKLVRHFSSVVLQNLLKINTGQ
jgi:hypothetical protein